jgi:hypothetical protein
MKSNSPKLILLHLCFVSTNVKINYKIHQHSPTNNLPRLYWMINSNLERRTKLFSFTRHINPYKKKLTNIKPLLIKLKSQRGLSYSAWIPCSICEHLNLIISNIENLCLITKRFTQKVQLFTFNCESNIKRRTAVQTQK